MLDFHLDPNAIAYLYKKQQRDKIDTILNKYSKDGNSVDEITDEIDALRNVKIK